jgi:hypothetical protein
VTHAPSGYDRPKNDLYETPAWVTRALLRHFPVAPGMSVWEPAAGNHAIADVLAAAGAFVIPTDIYTYARRQAFLIDFLGAEVPPIKADWIVTNPPYGHTNRTAEKFARLALDRCAGFVAMLCTAKFDFGKSRADLFADNYRFAAKIALTDRINWFDGGEHDNTESHAWYVGSCVGFYRCPRLLYAGNDGQ